MPPNSITLDFKTMPTVTVDGKTHTFKKGEKEGEFKPIDENVGGVTYSLVKEANGNYKMTIKGKPDDLAKYNFGVSKGRVTDAKFDGGDSMQNFFERSVGVGDKKQAEKDYFHNFSIGGAHLANRTAFLQSGAWGLDKTSASAELQRLEEEEEKKAKEETDSKSQSQVSDQKEPDPAASVQVNPAIQQDDVISTGAAGDKEDAEIQQNEPKLEGVEHDEPTVIVTTTASLTNDELAILKAGVNEEIYDSIDLLVENQDAATLREALSALQKDNPDKTLAQRILSDKASSLLPQQLSSSELSKKTEDNLAKLGLQAVETQGGGHCFYHAVGDQVGKTQEQVRQEVGKVMQEMINLPENGKLPEGLGGKRPTQEELNNTLLSESIDDQKAWGEDYHCAYVARAFGRPVVLVSADRIAVYEKDKEVRTIDSRNELPNNAIFLPHKGGNHWESAKQISN